MESLYGCFSFLVCYTYGVGYEPRVLLGMKTEKEGTEMIRNFWMVLVCVGVCLVGCKGTKDSQDPQTREAIESAAISFCVQQEECSGLDGAFEDCVSQAIVDINDSYSELMELVHKPCADRWLERKQCENDLLQVTCTNESFNTCPSLEGYCYAVE